MAPPDLPPPEDIAALSATEWLDHWLNWSMSEGVTDLQARFIRETSTLHLRARLNRTMQVIATIEGRKATEVATRVKSNAGVASGNAVQIADGLFEHRLGDGQNLDIRVAVFPTYVGETIMMRLPSQGVLPTIDGMQLSAHNRPRMDRLLGVANGLILMAGPMGAGKSTSLYAIIAHLGSDDRSVWTVEDPVERELEGVEQISINAGAGNGWADVLRGVRRSDLEVLMIGEIRDKDQARAALEVGNAGARVISSIHANDSVGAVEQLLELSGSQPRTLGNQLRGVISQRLMRTLHDACSGKGCRACNTTGYKGVRPIHEVLIIDDAFIGVLAAGGSAAELRKIAADSNMRTLRESAMELVAAGVTDEKEVRRVLGHD